MASGSGSSSIVKLWKVQGQIVFPQREYLVNTFGSLALIPNAQFGDVAYIVHDRTTAIMGLDTWYPLSAPNTVIDTANYGGNLATKLDDILTAIQELTTVLTPTP